MEDSAAEPTQQTFVNGDVAPALDLVDVRRAPEGKDGSDDVVANVEGPDSRGAPSAVGRTMAQCRLLNLCVVAVVVVGLLLLFITLALSPFFS